jgi:amino acid permease
LSAAAVILAAVFIIFAGYLAVGFAGYLAYPTTVDSNVLKSFPKRPVLLKARSRAH